MCKRAFLVLHARSWLDKNSFDGIRHLFVCVMLAFHIGRAVEAFKWANTLHKTTLDWATQRIRDNAGSATTSFYRPVVVSAQQRSVELRIGSRPVTIIFVVSVCYGRPM